MRRLLIAGNWKMNLDLKGAIQLASGLKRELADVVASDLAVFPPAPFLADVCDVLDGTNIAVGGQNLHPEAKGAFTGETSAPMLLSVGCSMALVGHSERRDLFAEDNAFLNAKLKAALSAGLRPILCCGEHLEERDAGKAEAVVTEQVTESLAGLTAGDMASIIIAYEPVWAIGTGRTATPEQANDMHRVIRDLLGKRFGPAVAEATRILYGGSVKPDNAKALMAETDIDGGLVGGASLTVDDFVAIVRA